MSTLRRTLWSKEVLEVCLAPLRVGPSEHREGGHRRQIAKGRFEQQRTRRLGEHRRVFVHHHDPDAARVVHVGIHRRVQTALADHIDRRPGIQALGEDLQLNEQPCIQRLGLSANGRAVLEKVGNRRLVVRVVCHGLRLTILYRAAVYRAGPRDILPPACSMGVPYMIGIAGHSGAGKSTLARGLALRLVGTTDAVLSLDAYHHPRPPARRTSVPLGFDEPGALDLDLLSEHLLELSRGVPVDRPSYDFHTHTRRPATVRVVPGPA